MVVVEAGSLHDEYRMNMEGLSKIVTTIDKEDQSCLEMENEHQYFKETEEL